MIELRHLLAVGVVTAALTGSAIWCFSGDADRIVHHEVLPPHGDQRHESVVFRYDTGEVYVVEWWLRQHGRSYYRVIFDRETGTRLPPWAEDSVRADFDLYYGEIKRQERLEKWEAP